MTSWMRAVAAAMVLACAALPGQIRAIAQEAPALKQPGQQAAAPDTPAGKMLARVLELFSGKTDAIGEDDLADSFKSAVPIEKLRVVAGQIRASEGDLKLESIEEGASERKLVADVLGAKKGTALKIRLALNEQGKIEGLLVQPGVDKRVPEFASWDALDAIVRERWPDGSVLIARLEPQDAGAEARPKDQIVGLHALNAERPLAIGSAFKLWVLGALAEAVRAGDAKWEEELKIEPTWKSLPSGVMQNEPAGKEHTLRQYAEKMISISDNTAADHLIHRLGRERCERFMESVCGHPERNRPFLTTRDLFVLKLTPGDSLPGKFAHANDAQKRAMVAPGGEVAGGTPVAMLAAAWRAPRFIDSLEWFASAQDLAKTLAALDALSRAPGLEPLREILAINPGVPIDRKVWTYAGFKGGSEPGVMSLNWLLERKDGKRFVVSLTVNDTKKAIDEAMAVGVARRAIEHLGRSGQ